MNVNESLLDLDKHAFEDNFPVLDNLYLHFAAARLTAFRSDKGWVIAFEILGYSNKLQSFVDDLYAFGSCIYPEGLIISDDSISAPSHECTLVDETSGEWIADWTSWCTLMGGKVYRYNPTRADYAAVGIEVPPRGGPGTLKAEQLLRFLVSMAGTHGLFMTETQLKNELHLGSEMRVFLQTEKWQHPDIAGGEKPSDNECIRSLLRALESDSPSEFRTGYPNTDWRLWKDLSDSE